MTQFKLTQDQIEKLTEFQRLSKEKKSHILEAVFNLEQRRLSGHEPSPDEIFNQLSATGHIEIGLACYVAQLKKIKWS